MIDLAAIQERFNQYPNEYTQQYANAIIHLAFGRKLEYGHYYDSWKAFENSTIFGSAFNIGYESTGDDNPHKVGTVEWAVWVCGEAAGFEES